MGLNPECIRQGVRLAEESEIEWSRDLVAELSRGRFEPPPWNALIGPLEPRGGPNGLVLRRGHIVAEWGDTARADMTFSVAKSYLAILAGIAIDAGLIKDVHDIAGDYALDDGFAGAHNRAITWHHLLQQTSEWEGTLWDKPDLVDRNRQVGADSDNSKKGQHRDLHAPGTYWEYNDVRVNRLSLSLMQVFRRSLPDVLRERIMDPIGANRSWRWHGYHNSTVSIDDNELVSVPGGSHWGGGLSISTRDHARVGHLIASGGSWAGRQLLSGRWIERMSNPCAIRPDYGYLWWLNTNRSRFPDAPEAGLFAYGAGGNYIWIDRPRDLVVVARWMSDAAVNEFLYLITQAAETVSPD